MYEDASPTAPTKLFKRKEFFEKVDEMTYDTVKSAAYSYYIQQQAPVLSVGSGKKVNKGHPQRISTSQDSASGNYKKTGSQFMTNQGNRIILMKQFNIPRWKTAYLSTIHKDRNEKRSNV